jgi:beta-1,4-mannosyltransferase
MVQAPGGCVVAFHLVWWCGENSFVWGGRISLIEASDRRLRVARFPPSPGQNPYLRLLYSELSQLGVDLAEEPPFSLGWLWRARHDVHLLHFHWRPDHYYAWCRFRRDKIDRPPLGSQELGSWIRLVSFAARLAAARLLGYRVVWTIHEVYPPETSGRPRGAISRQVDRIGSRLLARASQVLLAHDEATARGAKAAFGRAVDTVHVVPHGSYLGIYPRGRSRELLRAELGLSKDCFVFLCFGKLRPDKAVEFLVEAFSSIPDERLALVVAGQIEDDQARDLLEDAAANDPRIKLRLAFVPLEGVRELFEAADVVVFPRSQPWTSGSLILALSLGVPAVAARLSPYDELLGSGRAGWLFDPGDVESLRGALLEARAESARVQEKGAAALEHAQAMPAWSDIAARTADLMWGAVNGRAANGRGASAGGRSR